MLMGEKINVLITVSFEDDLVQRFRDVSSRLEILLRPCRNYTDVVAEVWAETDILYTAHVFPPADYMPNLKWVQLNLSGVDVALNSPLLQARPEVPITSMRGIHATNIAEYVLGMLLTFGHRIFELAKAQKRKEWSDDRYERYAPVELRGATVGIVGYGAIGREVARLVKTFGGKVLATKLDARNTQDRHHFALAGTGDPDGNMFDRLYPPQALATMVRDCDFVVITLPITSQTKGLFSAKIIQAMKPDSYLINVGRGGIVDEVALAEALQNGHLRGAIMDVFEQEPLPVESPLWAIPNLLITPHLAGNTADYRVKATTVFEENLRRYMDREPLLNLVDREQGY